MHIEEGASHKGLIYQQSTSTSTATSTPSATISPTPTLTHTVTASFTASASPTLTLQSGTATPSATPTATAVIPVLPTSTAVVYPATTAPSANPPSIMLTETALFSPSMTGTEQIDLGTATTTATLIPFPTLNLRIPSATAKPELYSLNQDPDLDNLTKESQPIFKKLTKFWPLALLIGLWSFLAGWLLLSHWLTKD